MNLAGLRVTARYPGYSCVTLDVYPYNYGTVSTDSTAPWRTYDYSTVRKATRLLAVRLGRKLR